MKTFGRLAAALLLAALLGGPGSVIRAADNPSYSDSVDRALEIVRSAHEGDTTAANAAEAVLQAGTGDTQPEIEADLRAQPPRLADARARLTTLAQAVRNPAFTAEPARADRSVHDILNEPRYASLRGSPSWWDRLQQGALRLGAWLLDQLVSGIGLRHWPAWLLWLIPAAGAAALSTGLLLLLRRFPSQSGREVRLDPASGPRLRTAAERFAEADRLAAGGDLTAAVRSLAGGVAAGLGDDRDWETSPLTVREIFRRSSDPDRLQPLLNAFEVAVYGGRSLDAAAYARAMQAAAPYRQGLGSRAA
ncbi:MAG: hypothetical protein J2P45_26350 [Candidatus Dormibacteraeota bacterium]|nr:hypothetical protein [Candidatus Dormibacteraeota bacterium]